MLGNVYKRGDQSYNKSIFKFMVPKKISNIEIL